MESKNYAVVFSYQQLLDDVYNVIKEQKEDLWVFNDYNKIIEYFILHRNGDTDEDVDGTNYYIYFLREGIGDATRFENIMWYTTDVDTPEKVIEWIEEIFYGK